MNQSVNQNVNKNVKKNITQRFPHRSLVMRLTKQRIATRYSGSLLGIAWAFLLPLLMVSLLALVFGQILAVRWQVGEVEAYGAILFSGLVVHLFVAECLASAPTLVLTHAHYVKSTTFPLHILPWTMVLDAGFHLLAGVVMLLVVALVFGFKLQVALVGLPLVLLPLLPLGLGLGWMLSALSAYFRDLAQLTNLAATGMLLLSPVLYPIDRVPESVRGFYLFNPLTLPVENLRALLFYGQIPPAFNLLVPIAASVVFAILARMLFKRLQPGFYDVL